MDWDWGLGLEIWIKIGDLDWGMGFEIEIGDQGLGIGIWD